MSWSSEYKIHFLVLENFGKISFNLGTLSIGGNNFCSVNVVSLNILLKISEMRQTRSKVFIREKCYIVCFQLLKRFELKYSRNPMQKKYFAR